MFSSSNPNLPNPTDWDSIREQIARTVAGEEIWDALAFDGALSHRLDTLFERTDADECDIGREFRAIRDAALELVVDAKIKLIRRAA